MYVPGGLVGLIEASDQLQKHLENLRPQVDEATLNPTIDNWFAEDNGGGGGEAGGSGSSVDEGYLMEQYPAVKESAERVNDMLLEESSYLLRQATAALNKTK